MKSVTYNNPVLKGFRPDPSFCFVDGDCYLVNSTFEYYPGVPVFHSRDLISFEQVGVCLTRKSQLKLENCRPSGGIYAPTIRFNEGVFYMITTNVSAGGNFIVHTTDITKEWSEPVPVAHTGIDPSLFFDDDGRTYCCATGTDGHGKQGIILFEIDPLTGEIKGEKRLISYGITGSWPEGPHIYKINGLYYLMLAECGTEYGHMETMLRSESIYGPYEPCPRNPILSNRYDMYNPIQCCGHADIAKDQNGNWWLMCLGVRQLPNGTMLHNLGRETFLAPVTWDADGWPLVGTDGTIRQTMEGPLPIGDYRAPSASFSDDFTSKAFDPEWTFIRDPDLRRYVTGDGSIQIDGGDQSLNDFSPTFVGVRQKEFNMTARVTLSADLPCDTAKAGIAVYYSKDNHYDFYLQKKGGRLYAVLSRRIMDVEEITGRVLLRDPGGEVTLQVDSGVGEYVFRVGGDGAVTVGAGCTAGLCTEGTMNMTFTGTFIGLFAQSTTARFHSFSLVAK